MIWICSLLEKGGIEDLRSSLAVLILTTRWWQILQTGTSVDLVEIWILVFYMNIVSIFSTV